MPSNLSPNCCFQMQLFQHVSSTRKCSVACSILQTCTLLLLPDFKLVKFIQIASNFSQLLYRVDSLHNSDSLDKIRLSHSLSFLNGTVLLLTREMCCLLDNRFFPSEKCLSLVTSQKHDVMRDSLALFFVSLISQCKQISGKSFVQGRTRKGHCPLGLGLQKVVI